MTECQIPARQTTEEEVANVLRNARTVAVVGISKKVERDSNKVAKYLKENGYRVIPVNPGFKEVLGEPCYPNLAAVPGHIDVVDIFRSVDAIPGVVDDAISVKADAVWMQLGLVHNDAAEKARCAGLAVVMNKCMKIEHARMAGKE